MKHSLVALSVLYPAKLAQADAPTVTIDIAVVGEWKGHPSGPFKITAEDLQTIKTNFDAQQIDVVIDYEHATLWDSRAPAAGWIKSLSVEGDKLTGEVEWTASASEMIKNGEYRYLSPVLDPQTIDQVTGDDIGWGLHSAALTNKPFLEELGQVWANKFNTNPNHQEGGNMAMTPEEKTAFDNAIAEAERLKNVDAENTTLKADNETLLANSAKAKVEGAIAAKKISKDQEAWALDYAKKDPAGFDSFLEQARPHAQVPGNHMYQNKKEGGEQTAISMAKV